MTLDVSNFYNARNRMTAQDWGTDLPLLKYEDG